mmetsp:Transcript_30309/g.34938  ORF Transcript_30309/g.34938 Transcript_30309/m.34938 type:complete len:151 (+) Transcript_30309:401-853(+)
MISTLSPKYAAQASIMRLAVTVDAWALIHGDNTAFPDTAAEAAIVLVCSLITSTACFMTNGGSTFKSFCSTTAINDVSVSNLCFVSTGRKKDPLRSCCSSKTHPFRSQQQQQLRMLHQRAFFAIGASCSKQKLDATTLEHPPVRIPKFES